MQLSQLLKPSAFVTQHSRYFFKVLNIPQSFLIRDPGAWHQDMDYIAAENIVKRLKVVNDTAERGVSLIQEFNELLTQDEDGAKRVFTPSRVTALQTMSRFEEIDCDVSCRFETMRLRMMLLFHLCYDIILQ